MLGRGMFTFDSAFRPYSASVSVCNLCITSPPAAIVRWESAALRSCELIDNMCAALFSASLLLMATLSSFTSNVMFP